MNLPDPAPYATPVAQAFAQASAMVNTFGTTTTEATWALQKWQTEYLRRGAATKAGHVTLHI